MGTWAEGNFSSDGALDFVGDLMDQLKGGIEEMLEDEGAADLDEGGESHLMPSVAIIGLLSENCGAAPPEVKTVEKWKKKYLKIYDSQIDEIADDEDYKTERRAVVEKTFDDLLKLSNKFWKK